MSDYEKKEFAKLMTVIEAATQNSCTDDQVEIRTTGHDPSASVRIKAYVLKKFIKEKHG